MLAVLVVFSLKAEVLPIPACMKQAAGSHHPGRRRGGREEEERDRAVMHFNLGGGLLEVGTGYLYRLYTPL